MRRRRRLRPLRELTESERIELDRLIAEQRADDHNSITPPRYAMSLDAIAGGGEDDVSLIDLLIQVPDYSPFGTFRMLMEHNVENTKHRAQVQRRATGWRYTL